VKRRVLRARGHLLEGWMKFCREAVKSGIEELLAAWTFPVGALTNESSCSSYNDGKLEKIMGDVR